jgi:hypothetical protein
MSDLYDRDFYAWTGEQADLLRTGSVSAGAPAEVAASARAARQWLAGDHP